MAKYSAIRKDVVDAVQWFKLGNCPGLEITPYSSRPEHNHMGWFCSPYDEGTGPVYPGDWIAYNLRTASYRVMSDKEFWNTYEPMVEEDG